MNPIFEKIRSVISGSLQFTVSVSSCRSKIKTKLKRWLGRVLSFLGGCITSAILTVLVVPIQELLEIKRDQVFCPNFLWCNTHLEFTANGEAQCSIGSVGALFDQAISDGDIEVGRQDHALSSLAQRTFLCDDVAWKKQPASEHLRELDLFYSDCFEYRGNKDVGNGFSGAEFKVKTGKNSNVCISNFWKNPYSGILERTSNFRKARAYCIPTLSGQSRKFSSEVKLPICSALDLQSIGFQHLLGQ